MSQRRHCRWLLHSTRRRHPKAGNVSGANDGARCAILTVPTLGRAIIGMDRSAPMVAVGRGCVVAWTRRRAVGACDVLALILTRGALPAPACLGAAEGRLISAWDAARICTLLLSVFRIVPSDSRFLGIPLAHSLAGICSHTLFLFGALSFTSDTTQTTRPLMISR